MNMEDQSKKEDQNKLLSVKNTKDELENLEKSYDNIIKYNLEKQEKEKLFKLKIQELKSIFEKYKPPFISITDGGEEPYVNFELQRNCSINWLNYKFQAQWLYEMAANYPFLYLELNNSKLFAKCIRASLLNNYFLHFSGSWSEGSDWENKKIFRSKKWNGVLSGYYDYLKQPVYGRPVGKIIPKLRKRRRVYFWLKNFT